MPTLSAFVYEFSNAKTRVILPVMLLWYSLGLHGQVTWFVKSSPGGSNTGLDWENAFLNPQDAFDKARDGDQIYIQSGSYLPKRNANNQPHPVFRRDYTFHLTKNIRVYGSFEGNELSHWDRNFTEPKTIFSGDLNEDDILEDDIDSDLFPLENNGDNIFHIMTVDTRVNSLYLDGIHIYGGFASSTNASAGAGIIFKHNASSARISVDIHKCMFSRNSCILSGGAFFLNAKAQQLNITQTVFHSNRALEDGAGIFVRSHSSLKFNLAQTSFTNHISKQGASIFFESLLNSDFTVQGSNFINSKVQESGGAIRFTTTNRSSVFEIERSVFKNNVAGNQGGALYTDQSSVKLNQIVAENNSSFDGGFSFSSSLEEYEYILTNSVFRSNKATNIGAGIAAINASIDVKESKFSEHGKPLVGGVFYLYHTVAKNRLYSIFVDNCLFERNEAVKGAVFFEAAINQNSLKTNALFLRTQFRNNNADEGGVFYISQNVPVTKVYSRTFFSCIFASNNALNGAVQFHKSNAPADEYFLNCTFYNNKASGKDPLFYFDIPDATPGRSVLDIINCILWRNSAVNQHSFIESNPNCQLSLFNCLIDRQNCSDLDYSAQCNNNIYNLDPLFFNAPAGDLRLRICSPAIDKGDNAPVLFPVFPETDIIKRARIRNQIVDLGAYEVPQPYFAEDTIYICPGDSLWVETLGWIMEPGLYLDTMGILNGCVDEHAYFALLADTIQYHIQTLASDCNYDGIEIKVSSASEIKFEWRKAQEMVSISESIKIQNAGWYYLSGQGDSFCPLTDSIFIDSIPRMPIFTTDVSHINCIEQQGAIEIRSSNKDFRVRWEGPSGIVETIPLIQTNVPGTYTAFVRDAMDCPYDFRIEILADTLAPEVQIVSNPFDPCQSDPRELKAKINLEDDISFMWETINGTWEEGVDSLSIIATASGLYYLYSINPANGCTSYDSIEVKLGAGDIVPLHWDEIASGCGDQYTLALKFLEIDGGVLPYQLSVDGKPTNIYEYTAIQPGAHTFKIVDWAGCSWDSIFNVIAVPNLNVDLGPDISVKPGTKLNLFATTDILPELLQFGWNNDSLCTGCPNLTIQIFSDTMIIVSAALNQDCTAFDSIQIYILEDPRIFIPSAFSPNGDGINDMLEYYPGDNVKQVFSFRIYNRWGEMVYDGADCNGPSGCRWDGKFKSMPLDPQQLVWSMKLEMKNGTIHQLQGEVAILK